MKRPSLGLKPTVKQTCKQVVLDQVDGIAPCSALVKPIAPYHIEGHISWAPFATEALLRNRFLQPCSTVSDPTTKAAFFETHIRREFFQLQEVAYLLDANAILRFRDRMEKHKQILVIVSGLLLKVGTVVEATLIAGCELGQEQVARSKMHSAQKRNQWHSDTKAHIDVHADLDWRRTVKGILINVNDVVGGNALLQGKEDAALGMRSTRAWASARLSMRTCSGRIGLHSGMRKTLDKLDPVAALAEKVEYLKASVRGKFEDTFRVPIRPCQGALLGRKKINGATSEAVRFAETVNGVVQAAGADNNGSKSRRWMPLAEGHLSTGGHRAPRK
ncbi:IS5/IS1182 family transposase [Variovorax sp. 770b2]|uniref:IS5/IS1182 family transposase n=1 Tax=Variovorax sp. 770b2 TaxID=1566271 RepID=UPI0011601256|nr:IS5/IS1182 family transposase [Variovorax sp. 770b2]